MNIIKILSLILMLIPGISLIGFIMYFLSEKPTSVELIVCILTIPFGFFAAIFLWLNALKIINL